MQIRYDAWFGDAPYRRSVYDISFYFLLPGMMSLVALIAPGEEGLWRTGFVALGVAGAAESLVLAGKHAPPGREALWLGADLLSVVLYALAALQGAWIGLPDDLGLGLKPLEVEGILVALLLFLGVGLAGAIFVAGSPRLEGRRDPGP